MHHLIFLIPLIVASPLILLTLAIIISKIHALSLWLKKRFKLYIFFERADYNEDYPTSFPQEANCNFC